MGMAAPFPYSCAPSPAAGFCRLLEMVRVTSRGCPEGDEVTIWHGYFPKESIKCKTLLAKCLRL